MIRWIGMVLAWMACCSLFWSAGVAADEALRSAVDYWRWPRGALVTWIPRAIAAGAEIRDLAMVGNIETDQFGLVTGLHYQREGG